MEPFEELGLSQWSLFMPLVSDIAHQHPYADGASIGDASPGTSGSLPHLLQEWTAEE